MESHYYKGIRYCIHEKYKCIEVYVEQPTFSDEITSINALNIIIELTAQIKVRYLIFNKLDSDFEITPKLYSFVKNNIYRALESEGIEKVFILVHDRLFHEIYKEKYTNWDSFMIATTNQMEIMEWIEKENITSS